MPETIVFFCRRSNKLNQFFALLKMEERESKNQKGTSKNKESEGIGLPDFIEREMLIQELRTSIMTMTTKVNLIDDSQREKK